MSAEKRSEKVLFTVTTVKHDGNVGIEQTTVLKDSKDHQNIEKKFKSYIKWGKIRYYYDPSKRRNITVVETSI